MVPAATKQPRILVPSLPLLALCCSLLFAWLLLPPLRAQGAPPVFRSQTELVRLDVTVTDRQGRPVDDVRPEELQITESGRPRPVVLFRHLTESSGREPDATAFLEVSRNETAPAGHLYVLVFDQLHMTAGYEQRARLAAERFITGHLKPGDAIAVYGLPGPGPAVNLTTDLIHARGGLAGLHGQAPRNTGGLREFDAFRITRTGHGAAIGMGLPYAGQPMPGADPRSAAGPGAPEEVAHVVANANTRAHVFLTELAGVMRRLGPIEGRKAFILFSEGFFADELMTQLEQVASAAAQSNSVVYGIDLNTAAASGGSAPSMSVAELSERRDPLATMAAETNGRLVTGATDLDNVLARIAAESNDYYLVGFEPSGADDANAYHRVKVSVTRPGLVARTRTGYSTPPSATPSAERQAIDVALRVPRTSPAIPIAYTTYERIGDRADKPLIIASMTAHVPAPRGANRNADVVFVVRDAVTGQAVASGTDRVVLPPSSADGPGHLEPLQYAVQFDVPPGEYWMRMLVREPGGVIGTADRRFHVWAIEGASLTTSDLIVTRVAGARFDPPSESVVAPGDEVLAYLEVYGGPIRTDEALVEVLRSGEVVATAEPVVKSGSHGETIVRARLPISTLAAGQYSARVRIAPANQTPRSVMRTFRVIAEQ